MSRTGSQGFWHRLTWFLVFPQRNGQRAEATASGIMLVAVSLGIGMAAYNSSSNILFITLALLLSSLLLSGLLSWLNLRRVRVNLQAVGGGRAGEPSHVELHLANGNRILPSLAFWLELRAEPEQALAAPESLRRERGRGFGRRLALAEALQVNGRVALRRVLDPGATDELEWDWTPPRRGAWLVRVEGLGSLFPFGFLRKFLPVGLEERVVIRPEDLDYQFIPSSGRRGLEGNTRARSRGEGVDLYGLRGYRPGDSHRLVHWKASARQGQLLVREHAAESGVSFLLRFDPSEDLWPQEGTFELGVRLASRLASDLFTQGRLRGLWLGDANPVILRRAADLELWLDALSCVQRSPRTKPVEAVQLGGARLLLIKPEGPNGAAAYADGRQVALA